MTDDDVPISGSPSPSFDRPPLIEVVLGVEFSPVTGLGAAALVNFADRVRDRYPVVEEYPPLPPNPPIGLGDQVGGGLIVSMGAPSIRLWLLSREQDQLLQIQRDRLILNWRAGTSTAGYPRYQGQLRPAFARDYQDLVSFLKEAGLPTPGLVAVEVTYVNLISASTAGPPDISAILRSQSPSNGHLGSPRSTSLHQQWEWPGQGGAASTFTVSAAQPADAESSIAMNLTARSSLLINATFDGVMRSLDLCHDEVVSAFVELTEPDRHFEWGRTS